MNGVETLMTGSPALQAADYANYFSSYAYLYHQKQMLADGRRMRAYRDAIVGNASAFRGKVVLDVGAGSGILSIWAAQAGAARVIACEFTTMAAHAERLVAANGLADVIEVRRAAVETLGLEPASVDVIVSEWMGYFLLRESMLDSVLYARDHYLKPGGALYPSRAALFWAPTCLEGERDARLDEHAESMADWDSFEDEMMRQHDVDVSCLRAAYEREQANYHLGQACWMELQANQLLAPPVRVAEIDLNVCSLEDAAGVHSRPFRFPVPLVRCVAFAGWFDAYFEGSADEPAPNPVTLATAPADGYTHWGQQVFFVPPTPVAAALEDAVGEGAPGPPATCGTLSVTRQEGSVRLYDVAVELEVILGATTTPKLKLAWELS
mmetsp:Transcript_29217/g.87364  ORF Transcript_29217/g.87364 Transcript_29217/m.87364 type:complete len:381 (+) Transcript_29217:1458-2600(+)